MHGVIQLPVAMSYDKKYSRNPDQDFHCFYPFDKILSQIPAPARGKDTNKRTSAQRLHAGRTSTRDVNVMLKWRHHFASQRIWDFLEAFVMIFPSLVVSKN